MSSLRERIEGTMLTEVQLAKFWARVNKGGTIPEYKPELGPCWLWIGTVADNPGYGTFYTKIKNYYAHRLIFEMFKGPIPEGLTIDHLCRVKICVNPAHLEAVTNSENILRGFGPTAKNKRKTHCSKGHELTEDNIYIPSGTSYRVCIACHKFYRKRLYDSKRMAS